MRYRFANVSRIYGTVTNTAVFVKTGRAVRNTFVSTVATVRDASGNSVGSFSSGSPVNGPGQLGVTVTITNVFAMPANVYSGTVDIACIATSTNSAGA